MEKRYSNTNIIEYENEFFEVAQFKAIKVYDTDLRSISYFVNVDDTEHIFEIKEFIDDENLKYETIEKMNKLEFQNALNSLN